MFCSAVLVVLTKTVPELGVIAQPGAPVQGLVMAMLNPAQAEYTGWANWVLLKAAMKAPVADTEKVFTIKAEEVCESEKE